MVLLAYAFHTTPSAWAAESSRTVATAVELLQEIAEEIDG